MPTATFVQEGKSIDHTPGSAVSAGDPVVIGEFVGVAQNDIPANIKGAVAIEGVYEFPKETGVGTDAPAGTAFYWDVADGTAQEDADSGTNKAIGRSIAAVTTTDATVLIKLGPIS